MEGIKSRCTSSGATVCADQARPDGGEFVRSRRSALSTDAEASRRHRRGVSAGGGNRHAQTSWEVPEEICCVTRLGSHVAGLVRLRIGHDKVARVCSFRVDPEWQHTSVAKDLLRRVRSVCIERDCAGVIFEPGSAPPWLRTLVEQRSLF